MNDIPVKDAYHTLGTTTKIVKEDTPLDFIIEQFAHDPKVKGVFLVDSQGRFAGVITHADLLRWARVRLPSGLRWRPLPVGEVLRLIHASKASDLARGKRNGLGVRPDETLADALKQMVDYNEVDIPVLDQQGKILGDLTLSEVLHKVLELHPQPGTPPVD